MINYIWTFLVTLSLAFSLIFKTTNETTLAITEGIKDATKLFISLTGIMCFWNGMMKIAEKSGVTSSLLKLLDPLINFLFPKLKNDQISKECIASSVVANVMGIGNAATALGIKTMKRLQEINSNKGEASNEMCMFTTLSIASLELIPTTIISLRASFGSKNSGEILPVVWIVSFIAIIAGVFVAKIYENRSLKCLKFHL